MKKNRKFLERILKKPEFWRNLDHSKSLGAASRSGEALHRTQQIEQSYMHSKLKLVSSPTFPCGQEDQTTEHVLQRCPLHKARREDVWPVSTSLTYKLYGCKQELEKTTSFISRAALIVKSVNAKKKRF